MLLRAILLLSLNAFAQIVSLESGAHFFLGSLQKEIEIAPYIGAGAELELSYYTNGYLQGAYSYLKLKNNSDFNGLHQFTGRAGIGTSEQISKFASVGIGISLAGIRGSAATQAAENYMLNSSESEFGWNARLKLNLLKFEKFTIGTAFYYDKIWTKPKSSNIVSAGAMLALPL